MMKALIMNEIQELALKSGLIKYPSDSKTEEVIKFSELLIQSICDLIDDSSIEEKIKTKYGV